MSKKITKSEVINTLIELGPDADFKAMLKAEFDLDTPDNAPRYQAEYLYKYALFARAERMPEPSIIEYATTKVLEFVAKCPWVTATGAKVVKAKKEHVAKVPRVTKSGLIRQNVKKLPDGTILWCDYRHAFLVVLAGRVLCRGQTPEKAKMYAETRYGYTAFIEPKLTPTEIVCNPSEPVAV
jgi:hypothetical protein